MKHNLVAIAMICHEANRAWCIANGDDSQKTWDQAEEWQKSSAIAGVQFRIDNPNAGPDAQHNAWMKQKREEGWTYGPEKDAEAKTHPCLVPYYELDDVQIQKDKIFCSVVDSFIKPEFEYGDVLIKMPKEGEELSYGQKAVGLTFNPSGSQEVNKAKLIYSAAIDQMNDLRKESGHSEKSRHAAVAITDTETAQMRAVKAITWRD